MNRKEWVTRCAQRLHKLGERWQWALEDAAKLAEEETYTNGVSGIAWRSPEDTADEHAAEPYDWVD